MKTAIAIGCALLCTSCVARTPQPATVTTSLAYHDTTGRGDVWEGGVRLIPISTPAGEFRVWTAGAVANGRYLLCPNSGHMAMYNDQQLYADGVITFLKDVDAGRFTKD